LGKVHAGYSTEGTLPVAKPARRRVRRAAARRSIRRMASGSPRDPFRASVARRYRVGQRCRVQVEALDTLGRCAAALVDEGAGRVRYTAPAKPRILPTSRFPVAPALEGLTWCELYGCWSGSSARGPGTAGREWGEATFVQPPLVRPLAEGIWSAGVEPGAAVKTTAKCGARAVRGVSSKPQGRNDVLRADGGTLRLEWPRVPAVERQGRGVRRRSLCG